MTAFSSGFGPRPRDDRASLSTARLATGDLPAPPSYTAPSPPGRTYHIGGRDLFVRRTDRRTEADADSPARHAWFVHGLEGSARNWDRLAAALSDRCTGFAPDLPGSGFSPPPARNRYSLPREADLLAELIDRVSGRRVDLIGNSRGGVVATLLAARHPDLVRSLTLISPAVPDFRVVRERGADARLALVLLPGAERAVARMVAGVPPLDRARALAASCFGEPEALRDEDLAAAAAQYEQQMRWPWSVAATVGSLRSLIRAQFRIGRASFTGAAHAVTAPTLVVWGTRDRLVDCRLAERTAAAFADHRLLLLPRTGHVAQMERPVLVARAVMALWEDRREPAPGAPSQPSLRVVGA